MRNPIHAKCRVAVAEKDLPRKTTCNGTGNLCMGQGHLLGKRLVTFAKDVRQGALARVRNGGRG